MAQAILKTKSRKDLTFHVTVVVEPDGDEFHAYCPALKGLHVPGATIPEAVENARVAAQLFLECLIEDGDPSLLGCNWAPTGSLAKNVGPKMPFMSKPSPSISHELASPSQGYWLDRGRSATTEAHPLKICCSACRSSESLLQSLQR